MEKLTAMQVKKEMEKTAFWQLDPGGAMIYRDYVMKDFMAAIGLINRIAEIAQRMDHHPEIHLTRYRNLRIILTSDKIGGLSRNDFIEAAAINNLPVEVK